MESNDENLDALANFHLLDSAAARILDSVDAKLEEATDETVMVNVEGLRVLRVVMQTQRDLLKDLVEKMLMGQDQLNEIIAKLEQK